MQVSPEMTTPEVEVPLKPEELPAIPTEVLPEEGAVVDVPAPVISEEDFAVGFGVDPTGGSPDLLAVEDPTVPLEGGTAAQIADIYNLAGVGELRQPVRVSDVITQYSSNGDITGSDISNLISKIGAEDSSIQRELTIKAISDPRVGVEGRIALAQQLSNISEGYDFNAVSRQAMHNANVLENTGDTDEDIEAREAGAQAAEEMPRNIQLETPLPTNEEEAREAYYNMLNQAFAQSEEDMGASDWLGAMVPYRFQVPVMRIYHELGLNSDPTNDLLVKAGGNILLGDALRQIREKIDGMSYQERAEALNKTLKILKVNAGAFGDGNDLVTNHTLEQIFYKDLFGKGEYSQAQLNTLDDVKRYKKELETYKKHGASDALIRTAELKLQRAQDEASGKVGAGPTGATILDNFGSIMDLVGLGSLAKSTLRLGTKWLPKSLSRLRRAAPGTATRTAVDALTDDAVRLKFPNLAKEDIAASSLPAAAKAIQEGGVEGFGELLARQLDTMDGLLRVAKSSNMHAAERAAAFKELQEELGEIAAKPSSTLHLNEGVLTPGADEMAIEAIFGRTKSKPFSNFFRAATAARGEIEATFGVDAAVKVVWRNPATGLLEDVPKEVTAFTKGEFFLSVKDTRAYEASATTFHNLIYGDKDVGNLLFAPSLWKKLQGPSLFSKQTMDNIRATVRHRAEWNKLTAGLFSDVASLDRKQQRILSSVLKDGEKAATATGTGVIYSPSELAAKGLNADGVRGYYAYRNATDIMFQVTNRQTRTRMFREGVKDVHSTTGRVGFAQPRTHAQMTQEMGEELLTYDAALGVFKPMSRAEVAELYKAGKQVARLEQPMLGKGGAEATHVIIDEAAGVKALGLPRQVMNKMEGYYPHMWDGNYVVYGTLKSKTASGQALRHAIGLASNEAEAKAVAERMQKVIDRRKGMGKTSRFETVSYDFDRQLSVDIGKRGRVQEGLYHNMGGPVYGHRNGGSLRNFSKASGDILVDPIESMLRGMEIVGQHVTKGDLATYMRQKAYQYAKDHGLLRDPRIIPSSADDLIKTAAKSSEYEKTVAYLESVDTMLNTRNAVDEAVSSFFLGAEQVVSRYLGKSGLGRFIATKLANKAAKGGDPMSLITGYSHRKYIASSPMAQAALQASQSLMMLGIAPTHYATAVAQTSTISALIAMRSNALHGGKLFAMTREAFLREAEELSKLTGMSAEELVKVVDTIMDSGIVSSVGYHAQMRSSLRAAAEERMMSSAKALHKNTLGNAMARFARAADAQTFGRMSQVGFEAGESINQLVTFLTLYGRDKAKGIANLADPDYVRSLTGSVAELTGDMMIETGFQYQRGWFKAAMQFVSFQHKMILLTLPKRFGGAKSLSGKEKAGMLLGQFLLYGRRGAPHMDAIYRIVDSKIREQAANEGEQNEMYKLWHDPKTKAMMDGVVFDTSANYVLKSLFGGEDEPDYGLAAKFAPGGGAESVVDRLFSLATNPTKTFFGIGGEAIGVGDMISDATDVSLGNSRSNLYRFFKRVGDVTLANIREHDNVPIKERAAELARTGGVQLFSTYDRYLAVKAAERMDGFISSGGTVTEGFSGPLEGILFSQFGIMTKDRESLFEAMDNYREETLAKPGSRQAALDRLANQYWQDLITTSIKYNKEATSAEVWGTLHDRATRERGLLFSVLDPQEAEYIRDKVEDKIDKVLSGNGTSAEAAFIDQMQTDLRKGRFGKEGPDIALALSEEEFVKKNPRLAEIVRQAWLEATNDDYMEKR